ncbi:MAG TPA: hypothetical protein VIL26_04010 [Clostridia bacterium]
MFDAEIELEGVEANTVDKVLFSSKRLNISIAAQLTNQGYLVRLEKEQTIAFPPGFSSFDITIYFKSGEVITAEHNGLIEVLKKVNSG